MKIKELTKILQEFDPETYVNFLFLPNDLVGGRLMLNIDKTLYEMPWEAFFCKLDEFLEKLEEEQKR